MEGLPECPCNELKDIDKCGITCGRGSVFNCGQGYAPFMGGSEGYDDTGYPMGNINLFWESHTHPPNGQPSVCDSYTPQFVTPPTGPYFIFNKNQNVCFPNQCECTKIVDFLENEFELEEQYIDKATEIFGDTCLYDADGYSHFFGDVVTYQGWCTITEEFDEGGEIVFTASPPVCSWKSDKFEYIAPPDVCNWTNEEWINAWNNVNWCTNFTIENDGFNFQCPEGGYPGSINNFRIDVWKAAGCPDGVWPYVDCENAGIGVCLMNDFCLSLIHI